MMADVTEEQSATSPPAFGPGPQSPNYDESNEQKPSVNEDEVVPTPLQMNKAIASFATRNNALSKALIPVAVHKHDYEGKKSHIYKGRTKYNLVDYRRKVNEKIEKLYKRLA